MERSELIAKLMEASLARYNEEEGMIFQINESFNTGYHTRKLGKVHSISDTADFAANILTVGMEEHYPKAFRALERICELQDTRKDSKTFGLWSYFMEEDLDHMLAPDYNWANFVGKNLLQVAINCGELLSKELLDKVCVAIRNACKCTITRNVAADYTNISLMGSLTLTAAGELLADQELFATGKARLEKLYEYTKYNGAFSEYNSSCYALVAKHVIGRMLAFFKDERCRFIAEELNGYMWKTLATHYNLCIGQLTPPQSRAYVNLETGDLAWNIWDGTDGKYGFADEKNASMEGICFPTKCPSDLYHFFDEAERFMADTYYKTNNIRTKDEDVTIIRELDSPSLTAYSYQNPYYSMGAFVFCDTWNQRRNCMIVWDSERPKYFRLRGMDGDYDFCSGIVNIRQDHNKLLGQLGLVSDRGTFHYILDKDKNGIYETDALYFKFEMGGETDGLEIVQRGRDFYIEDDLMKIVLHVEEWMFDGKEAPVRVTEDGKAVILEGYRGDKIMLDTNKLGDTYGVFTLTAEYRADNMREQISLQQVKAPVEIKYLSAGKVESTWGDMSVSSYRYTVPYRQALGLDQPDKEVISDKIHTILKKMQDMQADGTVEESCPISIISMDAWEWPQGVALFAMYQYYKKCGDKEVLNWLINWYDEQLSKGLPSQNINTTCPMFTLACLYEETKKAEYLPILNQWVKGVMEELPRTEEGGLQHIVSGIRNDGQIWDDTLYMTVLFLAKMGQILSREDYIQESIRQFMVHLKYLTDTKTGLFFHGWTFLGRHHFANALWGRGNSWYTAGLVDYLEFLEGNEGVKKVLLSALLTQVEALEKCQDESGLWHTLLDDETSYLETSASCAFAYGIMKAVRMGYLPARFAVVGEKALKGVLAQIDEEGTVGNVSYGTPVFATLQEYREVPICPMPYGQSMALMMLVEASI